MDTTLRQTGRELLAIATEVREIAARVDGPADDRWAIARDMRATAFSIERQAAFCEKRGTELGEPDPTSPEAARRIHLALDRITQAARQEVTTP